MSAFKRFTLGYEPFLDRERYLSMAGYNFRTHAYQPFDTVPPSPDDQRFAISCGPFDLMPDSSAVVALGIMFATWDGIYETPDTALALADRWLQDAWDGLFFESGVSRLPPTVYDSIALVVSPNPSNDRATATLTLTEPQEIQAGLFDVCGRKILDLYCGSMNVGVNNLKFAVRDYPQGAYFLVLKTAGRQYARSLVIIK